MSDKTWANNFAPSYTPMEMLDQGVFEGIYTSAISDIPAKYKQHKKVLERGSDPDIQINKFKIKSRLSLKEWEKKGWTTKHSPLGWWEWYIKYFEGRRIEDEDKWQIGRWRSFVARHQGQITASCKLDDLDCHAKQRQGLLQWGWDSTDKFNEEQLDKNIKRISKSAGVKILEISRESFIESLDNVLHSIPFKKW